MHGSLGCSNITTFPMRVLDISSFLNSNDPDILDHYGHGFLTPLGRPLGGPASEERLVRGFSVKPEIIEGAGAGDQQSGVTNMSNITSASGEASASSGERGAVTNGEGSAAQVSTTASTGGLNSNGLTVVVKRKRNLPGTPDPDAEVIALSPKTLMATNRFVCEICNKGFQRDQNLQLHRRGHNLPWKLKQRSSKEIRKRVYICPEATCVHHDPARALGDLTGIKKHFCRKHGEKKWKCDKCSKRYAVQSDWKAHSKTCGTREYRCDCGTLFSRRDSFITHRAFCDALAEENARVNTGAHLPSTTPFGVIQASSASLGINMGGPVSPGSRSRLGGSGSVMDTLSSASRCGLLPSGDIDSSMQHASSSSRPRLSLWLGNSPNDQILPNEHFALNSMDPFGSSSVGSASSIAGLFGSTLDNMDGRKSLATINPHYSNLHNIMPAAGQGGFAVSDMGGLTGLSDLGTLPNWADKSLTNRLPHSLTGGLGNAAGLPTVNSNGGGGLASLPSVSSLFSQAHANSSAQMSATALLQKAAQMGATASNNCLLKGFGNMTGSDSSTSTWPSSTSQLQAAERGGISMGPLGMVHSNIIQNQSSFLQQKGANSSEFHAMKGSPTQGNEARCNTATMDTTSGATTIHELLSSMASPVLSDPTNNMNGMPASISHLFGMNSASSENRNPNPLPTRDHHVGLTGHHSKLALMGFGGSNVPKSEDGVTRDFLGVRGVKNMQDAAAACFAKSLSQQQRELPNVYPLGMEQCPRDSLRSMNGINTQASPGRSTWTDKA